MLLLYNLLAYCTFIFNVMRIFWLPLKFLSTGCCPTITMLASYVDLKCVCRCEHFWSFFFQTLITCDLYCMALLMHIFQMQSVYHIVHTWWDLYVNGFFDELSSGMEIAYDGHTNHIGTAYIDAISHVWRGHWKNWMVLNKNHTGMDIPCGQSYYLQLPSNGWFLLDFTHTVQERSIHYCTGCIRCMWCYMGSNASNIHGTTHCWWLETNRTSI